MWVFVDAVRIAQLKLCSRRGGSDIPGDCGVLTVIVSLAEFVGLEGLGECGDLGFVISSG